MQNLLLVALGGALGSAARYLTVLAAVRLFGPAIPWGTLAVNIAGSLAMGLAVTFASQRLLGSETLRLLVMSGFLGGFTTFSAFSADTMRLVSEGGMGVAALYVAASVALSLGAFLAGAALARLLV